MLEPVIASAPADGALPFSTGKVINVNGGPCTMHRSRFIPFIGLLVALFFTGALGETVTIEAPLFEGGAGKAFFLQCARDFEKVRPDVKVDLYLDPRIVDKVQVRVLEGSFFEITNAFINYWPLIRNGDVLAIDKYLDGPSWDDPNVKWRDTFLPGAIDQYTDNGKHYGIPLAEYAFVFWYNKTMFRQHGWKTPVTWDELFDLCEKIKQAGIAPIAFQGRYPYYAQALFECAYYHIAGPNPWKARSQLAPGSLDCPEGIRSIELVRRLAKDYFQPGALGMSHTESQLQFFLGKTAMIPCGTWLKSEMTGKIPDGFEMGSFNLPIVKDTKADPSAVKVHVEPFFVMSRSKHPEVAMDFMRFMTSRKMAAMFARMQDIPTAVKGANQGNLSADLNDVVHLVETAKVSYGAVPGEGFSEWKQGYNDMMYDVIARYELSPQQIARKYEKIAADTRTRQLFPDQVRVNHRWKPAALLGLLALGVVFYLWSIARKIRRNTGARIPQAGLQRLSWANVLLFAGPAVLIYTIFIIIPCIRAFAWSLHRWNGLTDMQNMPFVGLLNFRRLLYDSDVFWIAIGNNLFLMIIVPLFVVPLAMFLATCISRGVWGSTLFRVVFFFPNLLGGVAATLLWLHLYNPQGGLVNSFLTMLGFSSFQGFAWLESRNLYWALIPISIWGACGFNMVLYLAGMESIPESYYEAATIDGASRWRQFWTITLPLIWEVLAISIVFLVIGGMKAFEVIWLLTNQQPSTANHVVTTKMIQTMFTEFKVGEATAIAVLLFLIVFIGTAAMMRGLRRETVEL